MIKKGFVITTSWAIIGYAVLVTAGFVYTGFKPAAQFLTYIGGLTTALTVVTSKRLIQKKKEFNCSIAREEGK